MSRSRKGKAKTASPATPTSGAPFCNGWIWWSAAPGAPRQPPKDDFGRKIPSDIRAELLRLMGIYRDRVGDLKHGKHYKNIGDGIWELRIDRHGNPYRLLFFRWGSKAVVVDVFHKTTQKTPKDRAIDRKARWLASRGDTPPG